MATWEEATQGVIKTAEKLIRDHHVHLLDARICFVFRSEASGSGGQKTLGNASKIPERYHPKFDYDFFIWLSKPDYLEMSPERKKALIDHELCHCGGDIDEGWKTRGHDIEEFREVIERHGMYRLSLMAAQPAFANAKQHKFDGMLEPLGEVSTVAQKELALAGKGAVGESITQ